MSDLNGTGETLWWIALVLLSVLVVATGYYDGVVLSILVLVCGFFTLMAVRPT